MTDELVSETVLDDKWRIDRLVGEGGMGAVYAASHVRNGNRVALKLLRRELTSNAEAVSRFLQEGYAANRVDHPGVVRALDDGKTADGVIYMVMELLTGQSLDERATEAGGRLSPAEVTRWALQWLEVMAKAHRAGIIHRDLKPDNVFLCTDGRLKVLDFGIARVREAAGAVRLTTTGVPLGTPAFMPPEQALAHWHKVDARSDVYAIGASLFTLLTGELVHDGDTVPEMIVRVSTQAARPIESLVADIPEGLAAVINRALRQDPQDRFEHAEAMWQALQEATDAPTLLATEPTEAPEDPICRPGPVSTPRPKLGLCTEMPVTREEIAPASAEPKRRSSLVAGLTLAAALAAIGLGFLAAPAASQRAETQAPLLSASDATGARVLAATDQQPAPLDVADSPAAHSTPAASAAPLANDEEQANAAKALAKPEQKTTAASQGKPLADAKSREPTPPKMTATKVCKRDPFTMRCNCARCE